jgi:hypothetical protein
MLPFPLELSVCIVPSCESEKHPHFTTTNISGTAQTFSQALGQHQMNSALNLEKPKT